MLTFLQPYKEKPYKEKTKEDSFVFKEMLSGSIYRILQKRANLAGLRKVKPHDLRRTFATTMLANGCDVFVLQRAMGHASVTTMSCLTDWVK